MPSSTIIMKKPKQQKLSTFHSQNYKNQTTKKSWRKRNSEIDRYSDEICGSIMDDAMLTVTTTAAPAATAAARG